MKKFFVFVLTVCACMLLAAMYGVINDHVTYTISPEYYTRFKFEQFGLETVWFGGIRQTVTVVGIMATWWVGLLIGLVLGLTGLIFKDHQSMRRAIQKAIFYTFISTIAFAIAGYLYGRFVLAGTGVDWWLPEGLLDESAFISVGSVHNFAYMGGFFGLVAGVYFLIRLNIKQRRITARENVAP
ncbi:hypothetical protein [Chitinophaga pinensis]|nr:hypothetical protein [Chitinophaga pinensis]